jgi:hypothetical protein
LENLNVSKDINRVWENIKEKNKPSAKDSLGLYEFSSINHSLMTNFYDFWIKGSRLKCSGYRIQTKEM